MKVPFYLMNASKEIRVILKESTDTDFPNIDNMDDLECLLEQSMNILYVDLAFVFVYLL